MVVVRLSKSWFSTFGLVLVSVAFGFVLGIVFGRSAFDGVAFQANRPVSETSKRSRSVIRKPMGAASSSVLFKRYKTFLRRGFKPKKRLQFMHIPKTGGTMVEVFGSKNGLAWGVCKKYIDWDPCEGAHPEPPYPDRATIQPPKSLPGKFSVCEEWHVPHNWYNPSYFDDADVFAIVRNPYTRAISEYYCPFTGFKEDPELLHDARNMNEFINASIWFKREKINCGHFLSQHYYVFDDDMSQRTNHVLHYENLMEEFTAIMDAYNLDTGLISEKVNKGTYDGKRLTIADLSDETIQLINENEHLTFELFGYDKVTTAKEFSTEDIRRSLVEHDNHV